MKPTPEESKLIKWEYKVFEMADGTVGLFEWSEETGRTKMPVQNTYFDSLEELIEDVKAMLEACNKPIVGDS